MSSTVSDARLDFRLKRDHKAKIEQAARICGQTVSEFAVSTLLRAADEALERERIIRLTDRDFALFLDLIDEDSEPNEALREAAARYRGKGRPRRT